MASNTKVSNHLRVAGHISDDSLADLIVDAIQDIKGKNILKMDLRQVQDAPADFFIICEGESSTQVNGIASNVQRRVKEELAIKPGHTEGQQQGRWVLIDYFTVVVHVFYRETREYYDLESLWNDAKTTQYADL